MTPFSVDMHICRQEKYSVYRNDESCEAGIEAKRINFYRSTWKERFLSKETFDLVNFVSNHSICAKEN